MRKSLVEQLETKLGAEIGGQVIAAVAATRGFGWPFYGGFAIGLGLGFISGAILDSFNALWVALSTALGLAIGVRLLRRAAEAAVSPGTLRVFLAVTATELVVADQSLWTGRPKSLDGRLPFSAISEVDTRRRLLIMTDVVIRQRDSAEWQYQVPRREWREFRQALPAGIGDWNGA